MPDYCFGVLLTINTSLLYPLERARIREIMNKLHEVETGDFLVPEEERRSHSCSNESPIRRSSSGITRTQPVSTLSEDEALAYLANVLVEAYFEQRKYARTRQTTH